MHILLPYTKTQHKWSPFSFLAYYRIVFSFKQSRQMNQSAQFIETRWPQNFLFTVYVVGLNVCNWPTWPAINEIVHASSSGILIQKDLPPIQRGHRCYCSSLLLLSDNRDFELVQHCGKLDIVQAPDVLHVEAANWKQWCKRTVRGS